MASSRGFELVHGIVDSLWLSKPGAALEDFRRVCVELGRELELPIGFEGRYRWIVFLNSKVDPRVPVLNRYYGVLEDGTVKVRGIELRRHDTPGIVNRCQAGMLGVLGRARNSFEFKALVPEALSVLGSYVEMVRERRVPLEELLIAKNLSKNPDEYSKLVPQAIAAKLLAKEGGRVHAGQRVDFVLTRKKGAIPGELVDGNLVYDWERYRELLISSAESLLLPFGYDRDILGKIVST